MRNLSSVTVLFATMIMCAALLLTAGISQAGVNEWTWMSGADTVDQPGVYGTQGVADPANVPGARRDSIAWADQDGNLWLFGGDSDPYMGGDHQNDLWRYETDSNQWTWMSGSNTVNQPGTYGTKGVPDSNNIPGARHVSVAWTDQNGDLWLFGGFGRDSNGDPGDLNDLWRYDPDSNQWTWMSGSNTANQPGIYGTQGVANSGNVPGARCDSVAWTDQNGDLWLFGGIGRDSNGDPGDLNDLWRYDASSNQWIWMSGADRVDQPGTYGTLGMSAATNIPGARSGGVAWTDQNGNFWLFGGLGRDSNDDDGYLNDLWRYSLVTSHWGWMSGSNTVDQPGTYGTKGVPDSNNIPGARHGSVAWTDQNGDLWLFGGTGYTTSTVDGYLNDLWRYSLLTNRWTWMSGSNSLMQQDIYGDKGVPAAANVPGARWGSIAWTDQNGDLWLFGGNTFIGGFHNVNNLWSYEIPCLFDDACGGDTPYCDTTIGQCVECLNDSDCVDGVCENNICAECRADADCHNNGLWCDGDEICTAGVCGSSGNPCPGDYCDETADKCLECLTDNDCFGGMCVDNLCVECTVNGDCNNGMFCDGEETCTAGVCRAGIAPCAGETCDETDNVCLPCVADSDCGDFFSCKNNMCIAYPTDSQVTTATLKGPGVMEVIFDPNQIDIALITLTRTTKKSRVTITSELKNSPVYLDELVVDGSLKSLKGKNVVLHGPLTATAGIEKIELKGSAPGCSIEAPWIGNISISEDFSCDMMLTGTGSPKKWLTLGKLSVKGMLWDSQLQVSGDVGTASVGFWGAGATLAVGVEAGQDATFFTGDDVATEGRLNKYKFTDHETFNGGETFGIIANEFGKKNILLPFFDGDFQIQQAN